MKKELHKLEIGVQNPFTVTCENDRIMPSESLGNAGRPGWQAARLGRLWPGLRLRRRRLRAALVRDQALWPKRY